MLLKISNITYIVLINIIVSLIDINNGLAINFVVFLINNKNNENNDNINRRDQKDYTLAMRYQKTIKRSASLFLVNNIYKFIRFTFF